MTLLNSLGDFTGTRNALQRYAQLVADISKHHGVMQPNWRHISLKVWPDGMITESIPLRSGGVVAFRFDLFTHKIVLAKSDGESEEIDLLQPVPGVCAHIRNVAESLDLSINASKERDGSKTMHYVPESAFAFFQTLVQVDRIFRQHLATIEGPLSLPLLWPHGFDLSCEWYGSRMVEWEEDGVKSTIPSQLNLGFYPGKNDDDSYFYSNPWPFDEAALLDKPLPAGATWHTNGWKGTKMPYTELLDDDNAESRLLEFAHAVFETARPTLV